MTSAFLGMLADTSIRAAVAAVLVGAALAAVRARAGAIRHASWTAVLLAMLLMPALTHGCLPVLRDGHPIDIRESRLVTVPVTVGLLQQTILLPVTWRRWPVETLRAALAHEAAHIQRRDVPVAFAAHLNRCLWWFHPLSWWLERTLAATAEQAADEAAMSVVKDGTAYASILVEMARGVAGGRGRVAWFGIGIDGGGLLNERIERALSDSAPRQMSATRKAILVVACLAAILIAVACRPSAPSFGENHAFVQGDITLASRLAWFLWNSRPDAELVAVATSGKLNDPAILDQQVRRMLGDERSRALISNVFSAWLFLRNVRNLRPDPLVFPDFDDPLRGAFQRETELFLESQLREDRGALELLIGHSAIVDAPCLDSKPQSSPSLSRCASRRRRSMPRRQRPQRKPRRRADQPSPVSSTSCHR